MARGDNRRNPNHTEAKIASWVERLRSGTTIGVIALEEGITRNAVYAALHRRGVTCTFKNRFWKRSEVEALHRKVILGRQDVEAVADSIGVSVNGLYKLFARWEMAMSKSRRYERSDYETNQRIYSMRLSGMTHSAIAEALGFPDVKTLGWRRVYVRLIRFCERAGIPVPHARPLKEPRRPKREPLLALPSHTTPNNEATP